MKQMAIPARNSDLNLFGANFVKLCILLSLYRKFPNNCHHCPLYLQTNCFSMGVHMFKKAQKVPVSLDVAWDFFSHPKNLAVMTPSYLNLKLTNPLFGDEMYAGQVITYNVKPILGIPMFWMTEITHVQPKLFFVDEQRFGPYALWHHQHHFREIDGGVEMIDLIHYKAPLGPLGNIANALFIRGQLEGIFRFRFSKVEELFGKWEQG